MMSDKKGSISLFEFLQDAGLHQHFASIRDVLHVYQVNQLKYVTAEDLLNIGMSKPETRRLKTFYQKQSRNKYTNKIKQLLLPMTVSGHGRSSSKDEFLLDESDGVGGATGCTHLESPNSTSHDSSGLGHYTTPTLLSSPESMKVPKQHIISADRISIYKEIGEGEFGIVQQGVLTDPNHVTHQVAVKCLSKERMQNNTDEFMKEFHIMQSMDHPNIVRLFGAVLESTEIMLITELAPLRSLLECLKEPAMKSTLTVTCLAEFAHQIASGMEYLEHKRLIHRDLAARNILVFSKHLVKVSDFGLSRALGVGKDYYQTNFSVNLKLPIAWCAPECITFLKFTSASDVWAFGVTLWEMFSYGFQPWAAHTGQQILEAIDQPNCQRLEQPLHCPIAHYLIMEQCWRHELNDRPTFGQLIKTLRDATPSQVQVVKGTKGKEERGKLKLEPGQILTVLDKYLVHGGNSSNTVWKGVLDESCQVGLFNPSNTVHYEYASLPRSGSSNYGSVERRKSEIAKAYHSVVSYGRAVTQAASQKSKKYSAPPPLDTYSKSHLDHVVSEQVIHQDNSNLGQLGGLEVAPGTSIGPSSNVNSPSAISETSVSGLSRTGSDLGSELVPLISSLHVSGSSRNHKEMNIGGIGVGTSSDIGTRTSRMGNTIGYLRKGNKSDGSSGQGTSVRVAKAVTKQLEKHEYQSISEVDDFDTEQGKFESNRINVREQKHGEVSTPREHDAFSSPLDFGPSLTEEVFSELNSSVVSNEEKAEHRPDSQLTKQSSGKSESHRDLRGIVGQTLSRARHRSRMHGSGKKTATVKPIKASDERTLESAIAMANALASKSMHDLDKRCLTDGYSPQPSPALTPSSPTKKFFWFPSVRSSSPRGAGHRERRPFLDSDQSNNVDADTMVSTETKNAYRALIESNTSRHQQLCNSVDDKLNQISPHSPKHQIPALSQQQFLGRGPLSMSQHHLPSHTSHKREEGMHFRQTSYQHHSNLPSSHFHDPNSGNLLPLPPKGNTAKLESSKSAKRHVRKNPLIMKYSNSDAEQTSNQILNPSPINPNSPTTSYNAVRPDGIDQHHNFVKPQAPIVQQKDAATFRLKKTPGLTVKVPKDESADQNHLMKPRKNFEEQIENEIDALDDLQNIEVPTSANDHRKSSPKETISGGYLSPSSHTINYQHNRPTYSMLSQLNREINL